MNAKRILALLLCAVLLLSLTACSFGTESNEPYESYKRIDRDMLSFSAQSVGGTAPAGTGELTPPAGSSGNSFSSGIIYDADYLMIYNPLIYDDHYMPFSNALCCTGDLGSQIITNISRADGLGEYELPPTFTPDERFDTTVSTGLEGDAHRAGGLDPVYRFGDTHTFMRYDPHMEYRYEEDFTCVYEGQYCYIWSTDNSISAAQAQPLADEFDRNIFEKDTNAFGHGRFTENGGKVNVLFYDLPSSGNFSTIGFFTREDILATGESISSVTMPNYDHAIITINSEYLDRPDRVLSTLAHEYQHQICASDTMIADDGWFMHSWLNEAMSAYAEELTYPGSKFENHYGDQFYVSDNIREGQSVYHFSHDGDTALGDYGCVFLFEEYLRRENGDDVFYKIHSYWRQYADQESSALASSVTDNFYAQIASIVDYPSEISSAFEHKDDEWMSKLSLAFLLELNDMELARLTEYTDRARLLSLYDRPYSTDIEGGGRILVATQNGSYQIPYDADSRLIYVALDSNFEPTGMYTKNGPLGAGESTPRDNGGTGFPCNGSKEVKVFSLSDDTFAAESIANGLIGGFYNGYNVSSVEVCKSHDALIEALRGAADSGNCGMVIVFLNDRSYSASGLSLVIEDLAGAGIVTVLANSQVPAGVRPWLFTYDYSRLASDYSELCSYYASDLWELGSLLSPYLKKAIDNNDPTAIQHS